MYKDIEVAVIPAAGLGTRFLPVTKSVAKEMLPIIDIPAIDYIVNEAFASGIKKVIIIVSEAKKEAMEHYFAYDSTLEKLLKDHRKDDLADKLNAMSGKIEVEFVVQKVQKGLGHAILCVKDAVGNQPFGVLLGDDIVVNRHGQPALKQLIDAYKETSSAILGVQTVKLHDVEKYGIVSCVDYCEGKKLQEVNNMVEKPTQSEAPSRLAVLGRYVLTPEIFDALEQTPAGKGGEIQLTDGIRILLKTQKVYALDFAGVRYDIGNQLGFIKAIIDASLDRDELRDAVLAYCQQAIDGK